MAMNWTIRHYTERDRDAVLNLNRVTLEAAGITADSEALIPPDLDDVTGVYVEPGGVFLLAEQGTRLLGMGALLITGSNTAEVKRMRVHPDAQRQGIGRALLDALEVRARAQGITTLSLGTITTLLASQRLYEEAGYLPIGYKTEGPYEYLRYEKKLG
jgi:GNAT superfamily N-acetyltransferase